MTKAEKIYEAIGSGYGFNGSKENAIKIIEEIMGSHLDDPIIQIGFRELVEIIEHHRRLMEDALSDANAHLDDFKKKTGLHCF